jgi:hypothetical protein
MTHSARIATTIGNNLFVPLQALRRQARQMNSRPSFTITGPAGRIRLPAEKLSCRRQVNPRKKTKHMGDKSPKANQKKSTQKQAQVSIADQKKKQALAAKQAAPKKK